MGSIMSDTVVFALHGFLGQSSDWAAIKKDFSNKSEFTTLDLFSSEATDIDELEDYAEALSEEVDELIADKKKKIFVGYSLGGRLGLHLLQNNPDQFDHYIFLSTNPGFSDAEGAEKNKRLLSDMKWASQISEANWGPFVKAWNQQTVFDGSAQEPERHASDYDLNKLKRALVMWTLSQQDDFRPLIQEFQNKISWVVGDKDVKYLQIAESMKKENILTDSVKVSSGHRIWLDQPTEISKLIKSKF